MQRAGECSVFFFESEDSLVSLPLAWMAWALVEADDEDFGQSFAEWPGPPQNMHKLLLKRHCLSCRVNFLSLQRWMQSFQRRTKICWASCFCQTCYCSCCCCRICCCQKPDFSCHWICCLCCRVCCHCCQTCSFQCRIFCRGIPNDRNQCDAQGSSFQ